MKAGVKIYEYEKGFVHAKCYLVDETATIGTINLNYRSLVHHFENGVWLYNIDCLPKIKEDILSTINESNLIEEEKIKVNIFKNFLEE